MSAITGEVTVKHAGKTYRLYLGIRGIGHLQQEFGADLAPLFKDDTDLDAGVPPEMTPLLRVVELALSRHHTDADDYLADDLLAADMSLPGKLIAAAIPSGADVDAGGSTGAKTTGKRKARR
ncbi:hypothetical protein JJJ17_09375 [Paracoccus caeni]|uniref:Uncharacterized protein n=1 Tax=Paracoccus caeni TaxID=657651 RepID=A0A934VZS0_9RHOB|nr:hypothetical protein [Paracoccus caeni]MBK4216135.1 hypothetical protein [Paracoccus caeni]